MIRTVAMICIKLNVPEHAQGNITAHQPGLRFEAKQVGAKNRIFTNHLQNKAHPAVETRRHFQAMLPVPADRIAAVFQGIEIGMRFKNRQKIQCKLGGTVPFHFSVEAKTQF